MKISELWIIQFIFKTFILLHAVVNNIKDECFLFHQIYVPVQIHCDFEWLCSISIATKHNNDGYLFHWRLLHMP